MKTKLSLKNFGFFSLYYAITEAITIGLYTLSFLVLSPVFAGKLVEYYEENAPGKNPVSIGIYLLTFVLFYTVLSVVYLHRDKERRLQYFKATIEDTSLLNRLKFYMTEYGLPDILYYCIVSIPIRLLLDVTFESMILFWDMPTVLPYILADLLFAIMYTLCVILTTTLWEKARPTYLTNGYQVPPQQKTK